MSLVVSERTHVALPSCRPSTSVARREALADDAATAMLALDEDDTFLEVAEEPPAPQPLLAQTRSLGLKQSAVRWLPSAVVGNRALALAGSWDDPESNELSMWSVQAEAPADEGSMMTDAAAAAQPTLSAAMVGSAAHSGCVLGMSVGGTRRIVAFTASGTGGASCYTVEVGDGPNDAVTLRPQWTAVAAPAGGLATLGVCFNGESHVCAAGEDGVLSVVDAERGVLAWKAQTREAALFDVGWCPGVSDHLVVTAGTTLGIWDLRVRAAAPQQTLAPTPGVEAHAAAALLCVSADRQQQHRIAAGASDGAVHVWDVRAAGAGAGGVQAPVKSIPGAHGGDVWGVQLGSGPHGEMLSCGSDGLLVAWSSLELNGGGGDYFPPRPRSLVQLSLPINSLGAR